MKKNEKEVSLTAAGMKKVYEILPESVKQTAVDANANQLEKRSKEKAKKGREGNKR